MRHWLVFRHLPPRLQMDWFQLSMYVQGGFCAQLSLSWWWLVRICLQDFPKWERWLLLVKTISFPQYHFLNFNLILPPFFFCQGSYSPAVGLFRRFPKLLFPGRAPSGTPVSAGCFVLAQLSLQLCGELIQLQNNPAQKCHAVAPECETSASGFARGVGWVVMGAFGCWEHSESS